MKTSIILLKIIIYLAFSRNLCYLKKPKSVCVLCQTTKYNAVFSAILDNTCWQNCFMVLREPITAKNELNFIKLAKCT